MSQAQNIKTVIYLATPHQPGAVQLPAHIKTINIYSQADTYIDFANKTLYLGFGKKHLKDTENIILENLKHSDYVKNIEIDYQNRKLTTFELYQKLLQ